jgi:hypothetical protein
LTRTIQLDQSAIHLLDVLRDLDTDGALEGVYGIGATEKCPLETAIRSWRKKGRPVAEREGTP